MKLQQCWSRLVQAEELHTQGHWNEAQSLYEQVIQHLPQHLLTACHNSNCKPCQLLCLLDGLKSASTKQADILNRSGRQGEAFCILCDTYNQLQFLLLEHPVAVRGITGQLHQSAEELYRHIAAFCTAQRQAHWLLELDNLQKSHHYYQHLQTAASYHSAPRQSDHKETQCLC